MAGFDSMYSSISGLNAYQSWIDMISNNIANVDTTGFKGQMMTFADLFYQNEAFPSAPTATNGGNDGQQLGMGVKVNTIDSNFAQGGWQTTGVNTDMGINGDGFFILNNPDGSGVPTYTRDGHFSTNEEGLLYDPATGLAVQGWMANSSGVVQYGSVGQITIPTGLTMQATATGAGTKIGPSGDDVFDVALGGNLDQTQWQQSFLHTVGASANNGSPFTVTTTLYDSLGNAHKAQVMYVPDTAGSVAATDTPPFVADGFVSAVSVAPATSQADTITIASNGAGKGYTLTDTLGNSVTVPTGQATAEIGGATLTMVYPEPAAGADAQKLTIVPGSNGLPAEVQNASGQNVTPATRWKVMVTFTDGTTFKTLTNGGVTNANGTVVAGPTFGSGSSGVVGYAYFDENGQFINTSTIEAGSVPNYVIDVNSSIAGQPALHSNGATPEVDQGNLLDVTAWGTGVGNAASSAPPGAIALGFWQNASLAGSYTANVISQNGFAAGTLANFSVGQDGTITGAFTNGQTRTLGQVAIARFQNEQGLQRMGSNQFEQTADSGLAQVGIAGSGVFGSIEDGELEQSNVSLSTEFTNLIVAQRAFEANTRGVTTADQNMQTIIHLQASEN